jgi:hypothetical protein
MPIAATTLYDQSKGANDMSEQELIKRIKRLLTTFITFHAGLHDASTDPVETGGEFFAALTLLIDARIQASQQEPTQVPKQESTALDALRWARMQRDIYVATNTGKDESSSVILGMDLIIKTIEEQL